MQQTAMRTTITNQARRIAMLAAILLLPALAHAQSYTVAPQTFGTVLDDSGRIVVGGCVWTYAAGTTTQIATYSNSTGTLNANPIVADYAGRYTAFLIAGTNYKFVYENVPCSSSTHGTVLRTADNIAGNPSSSATLDVTGVAGEALTAGQAVYLSDGSGSKTAGQWFKADNTNGYSSSTAVAVGLVPSSIASGSSGTIRLGGVVPNLSGLLVGTTYYIGTGGALTLTPPTNRRTIGIADTTTSLVMVASQPLSQGYINVVTTGTVNNWVPGNGLNSSGSTLIQFSGTADLIVTGLAGGAVTGQTVTVVNNSATTTAVVYFVNQSGSSLAANRFANNVASGNTPIGVGGSVTYQFNGVSWAMVQQEQGSWISIAYNAAFYTASSGTWTVDAGDVTTIAFRLTGRTVTVQWFFLTTSVSATPAQLNILNGAWGGFTAQKSMVVAGILNDNGTGNAAGISQVTAADTKIQLVKAVGNFAIAANTTNAFGQISFEVQ